MISPWSPPHSESIVPVSNEAGILSFLTLFAACEHSMFGYTRKDGWDVVLLPKEWETRRNCHLRELWLVLAMSYHFWKDYT